MLINFVGFQTNCTVNQSYSRCQPSDPNGVGIRNTTTFLEPQKYSPKTQTSYDTAGFLPKPPRENEYVQYSSLF